MFIFFFLIILFFLLFLSAWISAAEIGITSLSKYRIKKLIVQTPKLSRSLSLWLEQPHYLLTIILTVNVMTDMFISFMTTYLMTSIFYMINRTIIELFAWLSTSLTLLIFGEVLPKFYARTNSEWITIMSLPILSQMEKFLKPFMYPVIKFAEFLSIKTSNIRNSYELSEEEIKNLLSEGSYSGEIDKDISIMLERTLRFGDLSVKRIMTLFENIDSVDLSLEENEFLNKTIETSKSRIPVYIKSKDNIVGYVHIKDVLALLQENKSHFVRSLVRSPYYISEDQNVSDLLKKLRTGKTHIAFVKDQNNNIIGMITLDDILEEVVGKIMDECEL
ncbi:MAG: CNNM domain-containing protein [Endomicrobium sp.]|jgi:CBS domain containing-hemolysin-like protein|nr:CNNM domain-containing protein [Endomicrobium sp.]